jgi:hypothetical protein
VTRFVWVLAAAVAALAAFLSIRHSTPVDLALPLIAVAVTLVAAATYPELMAAVPLLVLVEMLVPDENLRLLAFGAVLAAAFGVAVGFLPRSGQKAGVERALAVTAAAIVLLRWIPAGDVLLARELLLLALALLIVVVLDGTPLAVAVASLTALATPAIPLRTLALPAVVLLLAVVVRLPGLRSPRLPWLAAPAVSAAMLVFAWSGVAARALPFFFEARHPASIPQPLRIALAPGEELELDVPADASALIVSGANVASLRRGAIVGTLEPGSRAIRIGDVSDWGYARREQFAASHNPMPRDPAGEVRGYGIDAWIDGAGRLALPRGAAKIRVSAASPLPAGASLQVEGFEIERR